MLFISDPKKIKRFQNLDRLEELFYQGLNNFPNQNLSELHKEIISTKIQRDRLLALIDFMQHKMSDRKKKRVKEMIQDAMNLQDLKA